MMKNDLFKIRAFTLIEVMVVLSVLAIIAILAYNFFGGTMREATEKYAATKVLRGLQIINDAADLYAAKYGDHPPAGSYWSFNGTLYASGIEEFLKGDVAIDSKTLNPSCDQVETFQLVIRNNNLADSRTAALDSYAMFRCLSDDACKKFNEINAPSIGYAIHDSLGATTFPLPDEDIFCTVVAPNRNLAVMVMENN